MQGYMVFFWILLYACEANRNTIANNTLRTGSVFHAYVAYATAHNNSRLKVGCLENVEGLADGEFPTNLDCVVYFLLANDIWVLPVLMDPANMMASRVSRRRFWLPHALEARLSHLPEDARIHIFLTAIGIIMGASDTIELDKLLLPEQHTLIKNLYAELENKQLSPYSSYKHFARKARRVDAQWPMKHQAIAAAQGKDWYQMTHPTQELISLYPGILQLSKAELSTLAIHEVTYPETQTRSIDVSQSLGRGGMKSNAIGCVKPKWKNYITDRCRLTTGIESFHFQGIHFGKTHHMLANYTDSSWPSLVGTRSRSGCQATDLYFEKQPY